MELLEGETLRQAFAEGPLPQGHAVELGIQIARATAEDVAGLRISRDGARLYTSFNDWPFDIWMLEGFR